MITKKLDDAESLVNLENFNIKIKIQTSLCFTEDPTRVLVAVQTLFPDIKLSIEEDLIIGNSTDPRHLLHFANSLRQHQELDASRRIIRRSWVDNLIRLDFDKQAALHNRFHFCDPDNAPLGTVILQITCPNPEELIDILAPKWEWIKPTKPKKRRK
ncbi:MAG: RNA-binding domain-containing protein [Promethearchaeota archaeon]